MNRKDVVIQLHNGRVHTTDYTFLLVSRIIL